MEKSSIGVRVLISYIVIERLDQNTVHCNTQIQRSTPLHFEINHQYLERTIRIILTFPPFNRHNNNDCRIGKQNDVGSFVNMPSVGKPKIHYNCLS